MHTESVAVLMMLVNGIFTITVVCNNDHLHVDTYTIIVNRVHYFKHWLVCKITILKVFLMTNNFYENYESLTMGIVP